MKRLRLRGQEINSPSSAPSPSKKPHIEKATAFEGSSAQKHLNKTVSSDGNTRSAARSGPMPDASSDRGKQPALPQDSLRGRKPIYERVSPAKQTTVQPGRPVLPSNQLPHANALIVPKDEPVDEVPNYELPIAMIPPGIQ